jgi:hypothetical protein
MTQGGQFPRWLSEASIRTLIANPSKLSRKGLENEKNASTKSECRGALFEKEKGNNSQEARFDASRRSQEVR